MNNGRNVCFRILRILGGGAVLVLGVLSTLGSGGGGGDQAGAAPGAAPSPITNLNFDAHNSVTAARSAAVVMSFFPGLTTLDQRIMTTLATSAPGNSPFDLAMCLNAGLSILTWIDGDHSGDLSMGDSTSLQFTDCDLDGNGTVTTGTVKFGFTSVNPDPLPNSNSFNAAVNLNVANASGTRTIAANFGTTTSTQNGIDFTYVYTTHGSTSQELAVSENGAALTQFGCFKVTETFSTADSPGTYKLSPGGVINAADTIMSLAEGGQLSFVNAWVESGTQRLLGFAAPKCAIIGAADGSDGTDGSYIDMEALGGDKLRLHTLDAANIELYSGETTWEALLNPFGGP